ncbi:hypothetical protein [Campylobacter vulpis]|nr:hypothetical protein [Campylobacter vulpis]
MNLRQSKFKAKHGFLRSKGTAWALGFGSFSGALLRGEKNIKVKK